VRRTWGTRSYWVYIMSSATGTIYVGVTNDIERRVYEHKHKLLPGFTSRYNITRLIYCEEYDDIREAIGREKEIKKWRREKKDDLVDGMNPMRYDLAEDWFT
jgi:putative endonuclease